MKAKDAVKLFEGLSSEDEKYQKMNELYMKEANSRIVLRAHGKRPTAGLIESVVKEMKPWCEKVAGIINMKEENVDLITRTRPGEFYLKYGVEDPAIADLRVKAAFAPTKGELLIEVMTSQHLDALSANALARMKQEVEKWSAEYERTGKFPE